MIIEPQGAIESGARWRVSGVNDGWRESGTTVSLIGDYSIEFLDISGWYEPSVQNVTVATGESVRTTVTYTSGTTWALEVSAEHGSVVPEKVNYRDDTTAILTAIPNSGYRFIGWSGDVLPGMEADNPLAVQMNRNKSLTALFDRKGIDAFSMWLLK